MTRPRLPRRIAFRHRDLFYKPQGVPLSRLKIVSLSYEEAEALRLKDVEALSQLDCAKMMKISQSTFQRILSGARQKVSWAIIKGWAIRLSKN
ncbi:MAG: hypothetical protein COU22_00960 [Candidatus Komeilibacteria bacterium CG10_big_fil_rev_8_21_14_0_10_41_13]|uniref:UPF0251 protein COU22_00960 n=1 Tax=Candidatus Komeilibacteria bacterium CG10_big_fil_rev_8_21_14_0_10_41_13 TaxID=1974476 RepID=A0A2M6WD34_9BACT|nr:MAG: hypothetical protein COU22_00960 [Candidatus Komeilibacteria bacterium CG10_big_fil_rev_8_21_14_0_10_41_13]